MSEIGWKVVATRYANRESLHRSLRVLESLATFRDKVGRPDLELSTWSFGVWFCILEFDLFSSLEQLALLGGKQRKSVGKSDSVWRFAFFRSAGEWRRRVSPFLSQLHHFVCFLAFRLSIYFFFDFTFCFWNSHRPYEKG
jgi:hypothetical protein